MRQDGFALQLETLGEHFTVADTLEWVAELLTDIDRSDRAYLYTLVAVGIKKQAELAADALGVHEPDYGDITPYSSRIYSPLDNVVVEALRSIEEQDPESPLGRAAIRALELYDLAMLSGIAAASTDLPDLPELPEADA